MDDQLIRARNIATIKAFLACSGPDRATGRAPLFTDHATKEMEMLTPQSDIPVLQSTPASEWLELSAKMVPQWAFYENQIFQTEDPNLFLVKSVGRGNSVFHGEPEVYINYYINEFLMEDGKIRRFRETFNPCEKFHR